MSRDAVRGQQLRLRIAQLAAQLMADHGIRDHALAKRKAARQLGITAAHALPRNEEIDEALRAHLALFEQDSQEQGLAAMRQQAMDVMEVLARFQPVLVGGLAQGVASRHSNIELEVYSDSSKEFEQFLLNADIAFRSEERRSGSFFTLFAEPLDVVVRILPVQALQSPSRSGDEARRRMTTEQLRRMLTADATGCD